MTFIYLYLGKHCLLLFQCETEMIRGALEGTAEEASPCRYWQSFVFLKTVPASKLFKGNKRNCSWLHAEAPNSVSISLGRFQTLWEDTKKVIFTFFSFHFQQQ